MYQTVNGWTKHAMVEHIKKEFKGKSISPTDQDLCVYRGSEGKKCAVGMFIPDDKYNPAMEGVTVSARELHPIHEFMPLPVTGMSLLQNAHDLSSESQVLDKMLHWIETNVEG